MNKTYNTDYVYNNYDKFVSPRLTERMLHFKKSFTDFLGHIESGKSIMTEKSYYKYLYERRPEFQSENSKHKSILKIMRKECNLYFDVKRNGLKFPIEIDEIRGISVIRKGNRRLMILKFLDIKTFLAKITIK